MPLDAEQVAELVVQAVDLAMAPILERLVAAEARVQVYSELATKHLGSSEPDMAADDLSASVTGLLRKELDDLRAPTATTTRKVIERSATGFIVTEEPTTA